jgi:hypothetical protein
MGKTRLTLRTTHMIILDISTLMFDYFSYLVVGHCGWHGSRPSEVRDSRRLRPARVVQEVRHRVELPRALRCRPQSVLAVKQACKFEREKKIVMTSVTKITAFNARTLIPCMLLVIINLTPNPIHQDAWIWIDQAIRFNFCNYRPREKRITRLDVANIHYLFSSKKEIGNWEVYRDCG